MNISRVNKQATSSKSTKVAIMAIILLAPLTFGMEIEISPSLFRPYQPESPRIDEKKNKLKGEVKSSSEIEAFLDCYFKMDRIQGSKAAASKVIEKNTKLIGQSLSSESDITPEVLKEMAASEKATRDLWIGYIYLVENCLPIMLQDRRGGICYNEGENLFKLLFKVSYIREIQGLPDTSFQKISTNSILDLHQEEKQQDSDGDHDSDDQAKLRPNRNEKKRLSKNEQKEVIRDKIWNDKKVFSIFFTQVKEFQL